MSLTVPATRAHKLAGGIWLAIGSLLVLGNLLTAVLVLAFPAGATAPGWVGGAYLVGFLAILIVPFIVARRSGLEASQDGLRVRGVSGLSHLYPWDQVRGFSIVATRPGWLLWLSRWQAVQADLSTGEQLLLAPTERHGQAAIVQVRDELLAAKPGSGSPALAGPAAAGRPEPAAPGGTLAAPPLPRVYRPARLDRVLAVLYLFIGVVLVLGVLAGVLSLNLTASSTSSPASSSIPPGAIIGTVVWVVLIGLYLWSRRERLVASDAGLEVVPFLGGARQVPWSDIQGFEVVTIHPYWAGIYGAAPWQVVFAALRDGSAIRLSSTERPGPASAVVDHSRDELAAILAGHGGPPAAASGARAGVGHAAPGDVQAAHSASALPASTVTASPPSVAVGTPVAPRPAAGGSALRAVLTLAVQLFFFGLLTLAAAGEMGSVASGTGSGSPVVVLAVGVALLIPAIAAGAAALGVEAWFRRGSPRAAAFAARPITAPNAIRNLPARDYAPILASLELVIFAGLGVLLLSLLPKAGSDGSTVLDLVVGAAIFGALAVIWARAVREMLRFHEA